MARVSRFEDLEAWKKARELTRCIYQLTQRSQFQRSYVLRDQMQRAATSVMSNIAVGFERNQGKESQQFLSIAKSSAGELRAQLYIARDAGLISESDFHEVEPIATEANRIISGLMRYLSESSMRGSKFQ